MHNCDKDTALITLSFIAHPYLLADNRHYTFYAWKIYTTKLNGWLPYICIPIGFYWSATLWVQIGTISSHTVKFNLTPDVAQATLWKLVFAICSALSVIFICLVEPRYFITPVLFTLLHIKLSKPVAGLQIAWNFTIHGLTIAVFLFTSFIAVDGSIARFMW